MRNVTRKAKSILRKDLNLNRQVFDIYFKNGRGTMEINGVTIQP